MANDNAGSSLYSGLAPEDALNKWYALRQKDPSQLTSGEQSDVNGNMSGLAAENPEAWNLLKSGKNNDGKARQIFNPQSGQWDSQKVQGFWDHPESWFQVLAGAGLGGVVAAPAIAGLGGGSGAASAGAGSALSSTVPTAVGSNLAAGSITGPGLSALGGGGGVFSKIAGMAGSRLGQAAGAGLAGIANAGANNRGEALNANLTADQMALNREVENRAERNDVWKKIQQTQYMQNRPGYVPKAGLPTYGIASGPTTATEKQAASGLEQELLKRLLGGSQLPVTDVNKYTKPGVFERIASYAAPVMGAFGARR